jgi:hypothetical protein
VKRRACLLVYILLLLGIVACGGGDGDNASDNMQPTVNAGDDLFLNAGDPATLGATAADSDGQISTYRWEQIDGPTIGNIEDVNASEINFTAPGVAEETAYQFRISVTDNSGASVADTVSVNVSPQVIGTIVDDPIANAHIRLLDPQTNEEIANTTTDASGQFAISDVVLPNPFLIESTEGTQNGSDYFGTLMVLCSVEESISCNASPITTLIWNMADLASADSLLVQKESIEQQIEDILGISVEPDPFLSSTEVDGIHIEIIRDYIGDGTSLGSWISFADEALDGESGDALLSDWFEAVSVNLRPIASAGGDQIVDGQATVTIYGIGTDTDGTLASFAWTQTGGSSVTLSGAGTESISFEASTLTAAETLTFQLTVTDNDGATHSDTVSVSVDPPLSHLSVSDSSLAEGDSGTAVMSFTVDLERADQSTVSVSYETQDGTATGGVDYQTASGTLTFLSGETQQSIEVAVMGDIDYADGDGDEEFSVVLSNPQWATVDTDTAIGTIINDDMTKKEAYDDLRIQHVNWIQNVARPQASGGFDDEIVGLDLDSDGDMDAIAGVWLGDNDQTQERAVGEVYLFRNHAGKGFTAEPSGVSGYFRSVNVEDFNNDGLDDVYFAEHGYDQSPYPGHTDYLFLQTVDGGLIDATSTHLPPTADLAHGSCASDVDSNGTVDVMTARDYKLLINDGTADFTDETEIRLPLAEISAPYVLANGLFDPVVHVPRQDYYSNFWWCAMADVDLDLDTDIILGGANPNDKKTFSGGDVAHKHVILFNDGQGVFSYDSAKSGIDSTVIAAGVAVTVMLVDDFNADGCPDFLASSSDHVTQQDTNFFLNDCSGGFSIIHTTSHTEVGLRDYAAKEDLDQDGVNEYVFFTPSLYRLLIYENSQGVISVRDSTSDDVYDFSPATFLTIDCTLDNSCWP